MTSARETYSVSTSGTPTRRIRTPHPNDVLCGRGGGINAHAGNKVFREWVGLRKEDYNLAPNKAEKTRVATEVMDQVRSQNPPGRFLQKDNSVSSGPVWWVEVDEMRALAKTSQALREGAPQIRLAHKEELVERAEKAKRTGKRKRKPQTTAPPPTTTTPATALPTVSPRIQPMPAPRLPVTSSAPAQPFISKSGIPNTIAVKPNPLKRLSTDEYNQAMESLQTNVQSAKDLADRKKQKEEQQQQQQQQQQQSQQIVPPLTSNKHFQEKYWSPINKRARFDPFEETPPLTSTPAPSAPLLGGEGSFSPLRLDSPVKKRDFYYPGSNEGLARNRGSNNKTGRGLPRAHSLALSDFSMSDTNVLDEDGEFVNPFEDESEILNKYPLSSDSHHHYRPKSKNNSKGGNGEAPGGLRNLSSNEEVNSNPETPTTWEDTHESNVITIPDFVADENHFHDHDHDDYFHHHCAWEQSDFGEGMKSILDVVHPDLTSPEKGEKLPTLLMPFRGARKGGGGSGILSSTKNHRSHRSLGNVRGSGNGNSLIRRKSTSSSNDSPRGLCGRQ